ncbi:MAG TPA: class I SAM-dependent methyltransferase [Burkholderiales bacterium]|nr:class I SAM-dependent methyltransferase [Burkholderiales bacterium]
MRRALAGLAAAALAAAAFAQSPETHPHGFQGAEKWAHVFDDPSRDTWQKPHEVIEALRLRPDAIVADIGAGTGYFAARLARMVPKGKVYAVDLEADMVRYLGERAEREHLSNMIPLRGGPRDANLPEPVDLALLVDVYHHIEDRPAYFDRLKDTLRADARVAIIDFRIDSPDGPPRAARIAPEQVKREMARAGYALAEAPDFLPNQYFLVFTASVAAR